jgi:NADH-quinone oxidoreductase subunit J
MTLSFVIIAVITLAGAVAAMSLRNLVHCALALACALAGLAAIYLQLGAQFAGFAQILVYVGAVAILVVFAILLTRGAEVPEPAIVSSGWPIGIAVSVIVFGLLTWCVATSKFSVQNKGGTPELSVRQIGDELMGKYVLPLEVLGLLLTAALIGATIIAMREKEAK